MDRDFQPQIARTVIIMNTNTKTVDPVKNKSGSIMERRQKPRGPRRKNDFLLSWEFQ